MLHAWLAGMLRIFSRTVEHAVGIFAADYLD